MSELNHLTRLAAQVPSRPGVKYPAATDPDWLNAAAATELSVRELAAILGCTPQHLDVEISTRRNALGRGRTRQHPTAHPLLSKPDWLKQQLAAGATYDQIAAAASANHTTVRNWVRRHRLHDQVRINVERRYAESASHPELNDSKGLGRLASDNTVAQIAAKLGCSQDLVRKALRRHNLTAYSKRHRIAAALQPDKLQQLRSEGLTLQQIGELLDCDPSTVSKALKRHHLR